VKLTGHTCVLQQFDKYILQKSELINFADIRQEDILTLDGLEKGQLIQLDDVTRIKMALRNQGQLAPFACYLVGKIGNFAVDFTEII
jgi:hypothetical protein